MARHGMTSHITGPHRRHAPMRSLSMLVVTVVLPAATGVATIAPALRAADVEPSTALRAE